MGEGKWTDRMGAGQEERREREARCQKQAALQRLGIVVKEHEAKLWGLPHVHTVGTRVTDEGERSIVVRASPKSALLEMQFHMLQSELGVMYQNEEIPFSLVLKIEENDNSRLARERRRNP